MIMVAINDDRFVLITGASSGIGRASAVRLAGKGFRIFATVRNDADASAVESASPAGAVPIQAIRMDVTDPHSIAAAAEEIGSVVGDAGLFGLVNNAGICVVGPIECLHISEWKNQFDVNFFGLIAVTQAMLPLMRRYSEIHRSPIPRIVNISSVTGTVPTPLFGAYCASKAAVESVSDTLRRELGEQDIGVSMIIPGTIQSEIWRKEKAGAEAIMARNDCSRLYRRLIDRVAGYVFRVAEKAKPAEKVAIAVERALTRTTPPIRTLVAWEAHVGVNARRFIPDRIFDFLMLHTLGLQRGNPVNRLHKDGAGGRSDRPRDLTRHHSSVR
jgi:NAD(P)-dependent dehydrogenase (short-subunit alcohol dehydrogenase family)